MENKNIQYASNVFLNYYSKHRMKWEEFYESERYMFEKVFRRFNSPFSVLDVGCGCGGLGRALSEKFPLDSYTGVDINKAEIDWALNNNKLNIPHEYVCEDVARYSTERKYDTVISLSCIDFNIEVKQMVENCWDKVKPGGYLIASIRLTPEESINDISRAFQKANTEDENDKEVANYVIFNLSDVLKLFTGLKNKPDVIEAYGYWCKPAPSAVIPYDTLCMSVFALHKPQNSDIEVKTQAKLELPCDFFERSMTWKN